MTVLTINENGHEIITCVCGIPYDLADHQTVYVAAIVREANLRCWESDPTHRVEGNVVDNRGYNAPEGMGPTGERSYVHPGDQEETGTVETTEEAAPTETAPAETTTNTAPAQKEEEKSFFEAHPVLSIVLIVLGLIVIGLVSFTAISVAQSKRRKKKMGIRKIRF